MVRKRCRHGYGLTGHAKRRAWLACGCVWGVDLYINGRRVWHNLGTEERPARVAELRLRADLEEGRRPTGARGIGLRDQAEAWLARKAAEGTRVQSLSVYRGRVAHLTRYFGDIRSRTSESLTSGGSPRISPGKVWPVRP